MYTYDLTTDIGKMRILIPDRIEEQAMFQDDELQAFLDMESSSVKKGTALAIESIATDEALVQKVITNQGLSTDGAATCAALLARAKRLREQAAEDDTDEIDGGFDVASFAFEPFGTREIMTNRALRNG